MEEIDEVLNGIVLNGGTPYYVGGYVRDAILSKESKDIDIEVFGMTYEALITTLKNHGSVSVVGKSFGVLKFTLEGMDYDFSLPRRERKSAEGHTGFDISCDPLMTPKDACSRRDFTINAMMKNGLTGILYDPFNGKTDLIDRVLRATSLRFSEDPLRVLRGFQFAARFNLTIDPVTRLMCESLIKEYHSLSKERVWTEWEKWATKGTYPSKGLEVLEQTKWINLYSELMKLQFVKQDPLWHPEGEVWTHTKLVCDEAAVIAERESLNREDRMVLMFAALCHDLGKATTTKLEDGKIRSRGHCEAGEDLTISFLTSINSPKWLIDKVVPLVKYHLVHADPVFVKSKKAVRRLALKLAPTNIQMLVWTIEADHNGRPPLPKGVPENLLTLLRTAESLNVQHEKPKGLIQGKHLIELGMTPSKEFGVIIQRCFDAQLDGEFSTEADGRVFLQNLLA